MHGKPCFTHSAGPGEGDYADILVLRGDQVHQIGEFFLPAGKGDVLLAQVVHPRADGTERGEIGWKVCSDRLEDVLRFDDVFQLVPAEVAECDPFRQVMTCGIEDHAARQHLTAVTAG